jgi:hypothetical protein
MYKSEPENSNNLAVWILNFLTKNRNCSLNITKSTSELNIKRPNHKSFLHIIYYTIIHIYLSELILEFNLK